MNEPDQEFEDSHIESDGNTADEDIDLEAVEEQQSDTIKKWREKFKVCEAEKKTLLEESQRAKADFLNARKRLDEDVARAKERAIDEQIKKLLPLCDSFTMAMKDTAAWEAIDTNWRSGVEGIYKQLTGILDSYGVTAINPEGESFDATKHEAVGSVESEHESETVVEVMQLGYERNGYIIRPAKVIISN